MHRLMYGVCAAGEGAGIVSGMTGPRALRVAVYTVVRNRYWFLRDKHGPKLNPGGAYTLTHAATHEPAQENISVLYNSMLIQRGM